MQLDHVHLFVMVPRKVSVSTFVGTVKGRTATRGFNKFRELKHRPYWGNRFWARGHCVDTAGLDESNVRVRAVPGETRTPSRAVRLGVLIDMIRSQRQQTLSPQAGRQIHPLSGVSSNPPAWGVDSLVTFRIPGSPL